VKRLRNVWGILFVAVTILIIFSQLPLGTALQFGRDEGFEVIKPFLCLKGFSLYKDIWSDQPPILTVLLTWAFKAWGPTILVARLVAAGYALILFLAFFQLVCQRSDVWAALLATFLLLASPIVLQLAVSIMLEVPAFATALLSALLLFRWTKRPHWSWLIGSGAIMGVALQTKLTSVLIGPAMLVEIALTQWSSQKTSWIRATVLDMLKWGSGVVVVFLAIGLIWAGGSLRSSFESHFVERFVSGHGRPEDYVFSFSLLGNHWDGIAAAVIGLVLLPRRKRWRECAFPVVLLLTAASIHAFHRPWWNYYYLHLAIPVAWLAGLGVAEIISAVIAFLSKASVGGRAARTRKGLALCTVAALLLARPEKRLEGNIKDLRRQPPVASSIIIAKMRQYAERTHWAYADPVIYPFHAQITVPPELAIVMLKRFWSGQITIEAIVDACYHRHVEQLVLPAVPGAEWKDLLNREYTWVCTEGGWSLYVSKSIFQLTGDGAK
jgi:4-amino-4-deoxy-L-arabinose transferase-like glycosyltransferase